MHFLVFAQPEQVLPPQSTSVSVPFLTESEHDAAAQSPAEQTSLWQSVATPQPMPFAHLLEHDPPQSGPVSVPFLTPSEQLAAWHTLLVHTSVAQSAAMRQSFVTAHGEQAPPQSLSVSVPF